MARLHALFILARTDPHKGHAITMLGIHVRLNLEGKACELRFGWLNHTRDSCTRLRGRRVLSKAIQQLGYTKVIDG